ncbi:winged helix-turn-helix domain-containing protein [Candidatus Woesearchaeota archaeon]|nr:winged helix-turn-helix domain-containing protein [Candidatus Woesearchaeota archaeon]
MAVRRITIIKISRLENYNINEDLQWFSNSLGLFGDRDKEKSCFRVFLEILKVSKVHAGISSEQIAIRSNLTRATVIHHINTLISKGLIISKDNRYFLRVKNLEELVDLIRSDTIEVLKDLKKTAKDLDTELGL